MEANKILQADVLDLVFEGRNKEYGAYELRKKYNKRILLALGITAAVAIAAIAGTLLAKEIGGGDEAQSEVRDVTLKSIEEPEPPPPPPPPPPKFLRTLVHGYSPSSLPCPCLQSPSRYP